MDIKNYEKRIFEIISNDMDNSVIILRSWIHNPNRSFMEGCLLIAKFFLSIEPTLGSSLIWNFELLERKTIITQIASMPIIDEVFVLDVFKTFLSDYDEIKLKSNLKK